MEDDDGFVFTRAPKPKRKAAEVRPVKPFVMDFTADVSSSFSVLIQTPGTSNPFQPSRQPKRTPPTTDTRIGVKDTFVALPISDTPIIRRNQDLRQQAGGRRRSSLSLRGNRTSSIGNGFEGNDDCYTDNSTATS
jgi:kinetochore protein Mis13/DSN1